MTKIGCVKLGRVVLLALLVVPSAEAKRGCRTDETLSQCEARKAELKAQKAGFKHEAKARAHNEKIEEARAKPAFEEAARLARVAGRERLIALMADAPKVEVNGPDYAETFQLLARAIAGGRDRIRPATSDDPLVITIIEHWVRLDVVIGNRCLDYEIWVTQGGEVSRRNALLVGDAAGCYTEGAENEPESSVRRQAFEWAREDLHDPVAPALKKHKLPR